ncbi:MAG: ribbon-helix-helix domain-containing protein [Parasphingopyxis sp.]
MPVMGGDGNLYRPPVKRSITIAGHQTSITLEPLFWDALERASEQAALPLNALVARIDAARLESADPPNLASALRSWLYANAHRYDGREPA